MRKKRRRRWRTLAALSLLALGALCLVVWRRGKDVRDSERAAESCVDGPLTRGIDVSYHQGRIDWRRVREAGIEFAFIRVSDGLTFEDPQFQANWSGAKKVGILRGAYQFFRPEESARAQADLMIAALARDPGELAPVIDVEVTGGRAPDKLAAAIRTWVERVRARTGREPIVYTSPAFWRDHVGGADLTSQPLWLAHYTTECPRIPTPWTRWTFWQHSEHGTVPGIKGRVDLDVFQGDRAALQALTRTSSSRASQR
jgi:lysozyme